MLGLFTTLSLSVNHVYIAETLGKELGKEEKIKNKKHYTKGLLIKTLLIFLFTGTNVKPNQKKSMFLANHTVVDWGPHSMWLSDCSDDNNNTEYD